MTATTTPTGFDRMGETIPDSARIAARHHLAQICPAMLTGDAWQLITRASRTLENDAPERTVAILREHLDLTGAYRIIAVLLTT